MATIASSLLSNMRNGSKAYFWLLDALYESSYTYPESYISIKKKVTTLNALDAILISGALPSEVCDNVWS